MSKTNCNESEIIINCRSGLCSGQPKTEENKSGQLASEKHSERPERKVEMSKDELQKAINNLQKFINRAGRKKTRAL